MSEYKRPNFDAEWWDEVEEYLENNPEVGFESTDVKGFIKFCVNREMRGKSEAEEMREQLSSMKNKLEQKLEVLEEKE